MKESLVGSKSNEMVALLDGHRLNIRSGLEHTFSGAVHLGESLVNAKRIVPADMWAEWLHENFSLSVNMAENFIKISEAEYFNDKEFLSLLENKERENAI